MADDFTPKASETVISLKFFGPEKGSFPASTTNTALSGLQFNDLKFNGGEVTADFSAGQQIVELQRIVKQSSGVAGQINNTFDSSFLKKYLSEGPLVEITVTQEDPADEGNFQSLVMKGLMKLPDITFLSNPGVIDFEIVSYGRVPVITFPT